MGESTVYEVVTSILIHSEKYEKIPDQIQDSRSAMGSHVRIRHNSKANTNVSTMSRVFPILPAFSTPHRDLPTASPIF